MIAAIEGILEFRGADQAIIKVGGVSLQVYLPTSSLDRIGNAGDRVQIYTHLHLREDIIALYGFTSRQELNLFKMLISVSGIGPKIAQSMLSNMDPEQLTLAIVNNDIDLLTQLPGIGKKTASRLVLELKSKLEKAGIEGTSSYITQDSSDVVAALTNLGYSAGEAAKAVSNFASSPNLTLEDKIRIALNYLSK